MNSTIQTTDANLWLLRSLGLAGVLGGLVLLFGDQLFYWGPIENLSTVTTIATGQVPIATLGLGADWRLILTGIAPLLASWGYALGGILLFFALRPAGNTLAIISSTLLVALGIGAGIAHAIYFAIGVGAKSAYLLGGGYEEAIQTVQIAVDTFNVVALITYVPATILTLLFTYAVFLKETHIPKWLIVFFPMFLVNSQYIVVPLLPDNLIKVVIMGGYVNLSFTIFFALLTAIMWNGGESK